MKYCKLRLFTLFSLLLSSIICSAESAYFSPLRDTPKAIAQVSATEKCVEPVEVMRRQHMEFILHQRDETMYQGIRSSRHSLAGCVNCHVTYDAEGAPLSYHDSRHFCTTCHQYAAVKIDCFQCHNSKPTEPLAGQGLIHPQTEGAEQ